jgi:RimJ/RimL family protein N-acetyltransferase
VERSDARLIVALRSDLARARYLHPIVAEVGAQEAYIEQYFARPGDYYFVIENRQSGQAEGLIAIYDIVGGSAEWGRWVLRPGSLAALESVLLIYRIAFGARSLREVYCRTAAPNAQAASFHDTCGLERRGPLAQHYQLGDQRYDAIEHVLRQERWPTVRDGLVRRVQQLSRRPRSGPAPS